MCCFGVVVSCFGSLCVVLGRCVLFWVAVSCFGSLCVVLG